MGGRDLEKCEFLIEILIFYFIKWHSTEEVIEDIDQAIVEDGVEDIKKYQILFQK